MRVVMSATGTTIRLSPRDYDAVLFDLDGVLTKTAILHASAWKRLFDAFLEHHAARTGEDFDPFDSDTDYRNYVDGKPRYEGVASFLAAREIALPRGSDSDAPGEQSIHALGKLKDQYFEQQMQQRGVEVYDSTIRVVRELRAHDVKTAVVSSSRNCAAVLAAAGIAELFDTRVDGLDLERTNLKGKPAPDTFLAAAERLDASPARTVVVEDALSGVAAGRAGEFGLVIGIDRAGRAHTLCEAGADVVVADFAQVEVSVEPTEAWSLVYDHFDPAQEGTREALCALGNGYFTTRGAACWARADGVHYPGTYLAGGYNRLTTEIGGRQIENESLVNFPNWLALELRIAGAEWFDLREVRLLAYWQELDLRRGVLIRRLRFEDAAGRRTALEERRLVSMHDMHLAAIELSLCAENWSGPIVVRSGIDARVVNRGAKLYLPFNDQHLEQLHCENREDILLALVQTSQSHLRVAQAARLSVFAGDSRVSATSSPIVESGYVAQELELSMTAGEPVVLEKIAALYSSRDRAISECALAARKAVGRAGRFEELLGEHTRAWRQLWRRYDVHLESAHAQFPLNQAMLLRLNMFHSLQAVSIKSIGLDIGVPARGWTGEAYEGHIFWDELFIFPFFNYRTPEITRSLLLYRYRRLDEARAAASRAGFRGAMFPWQSGSDGQEETQEQNFNSRSKRWIKDNSYLQRHVGSAIAYNVWQYFQVTQDIEFLQSYGAELILEIARFWSSIATLDSARGRYEIRGVVGPDEFHDAYPGSSEPGLDNNAYTNVMAACVLRYALATLEILPDIRRRELRSQLQLTADELARWDDISRRMFVPFHDGDIISQFEGYEALSEFDWESYRQRYGNIQRLDLILEAEHDSTNRYKLSKQADVLMLFYVFSADELRELFTRLGYDLEPETITRNVAYYDQRSSHGSTLSRVVHAWVLARSDRRRALRYFAEALQSDVSDIQQGTTAEGIHLGAMAGTVDLVQRMMTGIEVSGGVLRLNPRLPIEVRRLDMRIRYRGHTLDVRLTHDSLAIHGRERGAQPIQLAWKNEVHEFAGGSTRVFEIEPD
jgi:beta-phosphoglucomutase family hydrolase